MIGVLVSGNGSNLQALIDAGLPIAAVASNRKDAYALVRARAAGLDPDLAPVPDTDGTAALDLFAGSHDVVVARRHLVDGARYDDELAGSGTLTPAEHHRFVVEPRAWEAIPALARQFDEPFADSSALPTWYVSRETRREVTVALTGDAGDELFGGYDRYRALAMTAMLDRLPAGTRAFLGGPLARALPASAHAKTRIRRVKRLLEGVREPILSRYLRWMTSFDESTRAGLYTDEFVASLARGADVLCHDMLLTRSQFLSKTAA